jgi:hypothetical protein
VPDLLQFSQYKPLVEKEKYVYSWARVSHCKILVVQINLLSKLKSNSVVQEKAVDP